jgi:hypothetical protein
MPQFLMVALAVNITDAQVVPAGAMWDLSKQPIATITSKNGFNNYRRLQIHLILQM